MILAEEVNAIYTASRSNFPHSCLFTTFHLFSFSVSPWCWKLALPAFGRLSVEHV